MGEVYEAVHDRIARQVAIKVLHPDLARSAETAGRFLNEARAVNIVGHPALVQISDHGQLPDGTTYIVMEFLAGETLAQYLQRQGGRLPEMQVLYFGQQIALALTAAHQKHIVHRDLKPANAMLVHDPSFPGGLRVKLLDFGIAKVGRENQAPGDDLVKTRAGMFMGSPLYMSPEQCHGAETVSPQSDVYSLGVMLYHMLSGAPPFTGDSAATVLGMHLFQQATPLLERTPKVSPLLATLIDSMLRKAPEQRPTMAEVARQLALRLREQQQKGTPATIFQRRLAIGVAASLVGLAALWVVLSTSGLTSRRSSGVDSCSSAAFCRDTLPVEVARLRSLAVFSDHDVWACGDPGVVLHFDGKGWQLVQRGVEHRLHQLFGFHPADIWVVGDNGTILHYDGKSFTRMPTTSSAYLTGIWGAKPDDLWVVGKAHEGQGTLLHFDGTRWQSLPSGTPNTLLAIWGLNQKQIWAAGHQGTILHYDGTQWRVAQESITTQKLTGLWGTGERDVWAVGHEGVAAHYDGKTWTLLSPHVGGHLNGVWSSSPSDVWIAGDHGLILHYDGNRFVRVDSGVTSDLDQIGGVLGSAGKRHLWAVGDPATLLHHYE
jgi:serine/threonine protein kinase